MPRTRPAVNKSSATTKPATPKKAATKKTSQKKGEKNEEGNHKSSKRAGAVAYTLRPENDAMVLISTDEIIKRLKKHPTKALLDDAKAGYTTYDPAADPDSITEEQLKERIAKLTFGMHPRVTAGSVVVGHMRQYAAICNAWNPIRKKKGRTIDHKKARSALGTLYMQREDAFEVRELQDKAIEKYYSEDAEKEGKEMDENDD